LPIEDLISAIYRRDKAHIEQLLESRIDINDFDEEGRQPLIHAILAEHTDIAIVQLLIDHGSDVNLVEPDQKWTPLHFAARDQKTEIVRVLLNAGALPDAKDIFGNSPLWRAVMNNSPDLELLSLLLANGADPCRKNKHGVSAIDTAENLGNIQLVALLRGTQ